MSPNSGLMQGKRGVILGVANNRSIAWGIAKACRAAGAEIALAVENAALTSGSPDMVGTKFLYEKAAQLMAAHSTMATEGTLTRLYTRWLMDRLPTGERLNVPISPQLAEMYRALGQPD